MTPAGLDYIAKTCLSKDPDDRWQSARDLQRELKRVDTGAIAHAETLPAGWRRAMPWVTGGAVGAVVVGAGLGAGILGLGRTPPDSAPTHLPLSTPTGVAPIDEKFRPSVAISPDGRYLVYVGSSPGQPLYGQNLDGSDDAQPIRGTEGAVAPFFSPDGKWIGFAADNALQKVALSGGEPLRLAAASAFQGGTFSPDGDTIYYSPKSGDGIWQVSSNGGEAEPVTVPNRDGFDNEHFGPDALPDGTGLLYTSCCSRSTVVHLDLETGKKTPLRENAFYGKYVPTGHLVFAEPGLLLAATFDPETMELGTPVEIGDDVIVGVEMHAEYAFSRTGALFYLAGPSAFERKLVQYDRSGAMRELVPEPRAYHIGMSLSPDGVRLAVPIYEGKLDVFLFDLIRGDFDPLIVSPCNDFSPVWSSDGKNIAFTEVDPDFRTSS